MRQRGRAAAQTRTAILAAAHWLLDHREATTLALHDVAEAAGVSRATIYKSIGSRRELLAAVFEDQGRLIEFDRVLAAIRRADPARAVVAAVRESCRAWAVMPDAIRRTLALAVADADVATLVDDYERYRRRELGALAGRAHRAGVLARGLGPRDAAAALALLTGFPAFDQLRLDHDVATATARLVRIARTCLCSSEDKE